MSDKALTVVKREPVKQEPWRQRLVRSLLYGRNVDRVAKARARVGFAMLAFVAVYAVIGGRLVMFATGGDAHGMRRGPGQDAIATARPNIVDRNGHVLSAEISKSSGRDALDRETLELIARAQPLPAMPAEMGGDRLDAIVPVNFSLHG